MAVPYIFATATTSIPLSQLDSNFATPITLGNTSVYLGNATTTVGNLTLTNTTISSVATTFPNSFLANSSLTIGTTNVSLGGTASSLANVTLSNVTITSGSINITNVSVSNITVTGGTIDGTAIGSTSASTGKFTTLTDSGLTSGRVTYAGTGGLLQDSANFTFNGTAMTLAGQLNLTNASDYNLYASGAGKNYMAGALGIGINYGLNKLTVAGYNNGVNASYATYQGAIVLNDSGITTVNANGGFEFKASVFGAGYGSKIVSFDDGSLAFAVRSNSATWSEYARINTSGTISLGGVVGSQSLQVTPVASAVNYFNVAGATTGNIPTLYASGSDTNISLLYQAKGTGAHYFQANSGLYVQNLSGNTQFAISNTTSAVNYLQVTGGATGSPPYIVAAGSDTNIDLALFTAGTGVLKFGTYTAGTVVQAGYISIKDAAGNTRRLLVG
jgi:hypothetical protein